MYSNDFDSMTNNLRDSAEGNNDGYDVTFPLTGYEPNDMELNNTVPSKFTDSPPSSDQDMDDTTLGKLLAEVHREKRRLPQSGRCFCQSVVNVCHGRSNGETCGKE